MSFIKKIMGLKAPVRAHINDFENRVDNEFNLINSSLIKSNRFYNRTYTGNSSGNVNTTLPLSQNTVVVHNLVSVAGGNPQAYHVESFIISGNLWFKLYETGTPKINTEFEINFITLTYSGTV